MYGVVWCGVVWCGVVWCGVVWCGVVWCGVVWCGCGVVWCGVVWWGGVHGNPDLCSSLKAVFQLHVFHTYVRARKTLNPFQYYS